MLLQGETMSDTQLTGTLSGDVEALNGKPIFVTVEDPAGLFQPTAMLFLTKPATGWQYRLDLTGKTLDTSGHHTGTLKVRACLDAACASPLAGTPVQVPYDVTVTAGLVVAPSLQVTVPFGTVPDLQYLDIGRSSPSSTWVAENVTAVDGRERVVMVGQSSTDTAYGGASFPNIITSSDARLKLRLLPALPGAYTELVRVRTTAQLPDGRQRNYASDVTVLYTVTPNPAVDHVFWPSRLDLTRRQNDPLAKDAFHMLVPGPGVTAQFLRVDYRGVQPAAGSSGTFFEWYFYNSGSTGICINPYLPGVGNVQSCLGAGVYTAEVRYRLTSAAGSRDVSFPISLTVMP